MGVRISSHNFLRSLSLRSPVLAGLILLLPSGLAAQAKRDTTTVQASLPVVNLDPLIVTVTQLDVLRSRLPNSVSVVTRERLEESGSASVLAAVSEQVPGVFVTQRGVLGYGVGQGAAGVISIRGAGGSPNTQVLVMTDGRPQMMGLMGHPIPDLHLSSGVERVEVVRGPASVLYGTGALGGVVNVITRRRWAPGLGVEGGASYGAFDTRRFEAAAEYGLGEESGIAVAGGSFRTSGHRPWSSFAIEHLSARGSSALSSGLTLLADFAISDLETYDPGKVASPLVDNWVDIVRGGTGVAVENHGERVSGATRVFMNFGRHKIHDGFYSRDYTIGLHLHQGIALPGEVALTVGAEATRFGGEAENAISGFSWGKSHADEIGVFGVLHLPLGGRIFGTGGLRLNHHSIYGAEFAPQAGIAVALDDETTVRAHTARGFRSPTLRELYLFPFPTLDLEPERAWNHEVSVLRRFGGTASIEVAAYQMEGSNQIRVGGAPPNMRLENSGSFRYRGGEVALQVSAAAGLDLDLSYGYLDPGSLTLSHPQHQVSGGLRYQVGGVAARLGAQHVAGHYGADGAVDRLPDYTVVDARLGIQVAGRYSLYLSAENLLDEEYQITPGYPMPGRGVSVGLRARSR
jgi:iron complex outermembrane receptor protein